MTDRTSRLAELLLAEQSIKELFLLTRFDYRNEAENNQDFCNLTSIEKVMYAILKRVTFKINYCSDFRLFVKSQEQIGKYRVDFLIQSFFKPLSQKCQSFIIECDGHDFHEKTKEQAKHDKERDRYFTKNGFKVLHYTGSEIYNNFPDIEDEIEDFLVSTLEIEDYEGGDIEND